MRRDGCTQVAVRQARSDRGIDITACTADGRTVAVRCKSRHSRSSVPEAWTAGVRLKALRQVARNGKARSRKRKLRLRASAV
nr:hypothetical protein [Streptomyces sp. S1D4-11]